MRTVLNVLFNAFMLLSALLLTFVVLVQEEEYGLGRRSNVIETIERTAAQYWPAAYKGSPSTTPPNNL